MGYNDEGRYKVVAAIDVETDLDEFVSYLLVKKKSRQAAKNLIEDYERTVEQLASVAGSLKLDDEKDIAALGYRRIHFGRHNYFLLYRIVENTVFVDRMFHDLQDYRNAMKL